MTEQFSITIPLILHFEKDIKYKEVQRITKELYDYLKSQAWDKATLTLGKAQLRKETIY